MRRFFLICLCMMLTIVTASMSFANEVQVITADKSVSGSISLEDESVTVSDVMTFDEVVEAIASESNITKTEAANRVVNSYKQNHSRSQASLMSTYHAASRATFRSVRKKFRAYLFYEPTLNFYCETSEGG